MSRPDLLTALRAATPPAPPELRAHIRELATAASPPPRRLGWRVPLARIALVSIAAVAAVVLLPGSSGQRVEGGAPVVAAQTPRPHLPALAPAASAAVPAAPSRAVALPGPSATRAQSYAATLSLRLPDGSAVARAARQAVQIARALGGYPQSAKVSVNARAGTASIALRVPRGRVSDAVNRLSSLGTVVGERVSITDLQGGVDATTRRIARLEGELAATLREPQTVETEKLAAALRARIDGLRGARAETLRGARDATVSLRLATAVRPSVRAHRQVGRHGPFHALGRIFRLAGIAAVYALAIGAPLAFLALLVWLLGSRIRRGKEDRLLSRS